MTHLAPIGVVLFGFGLYLAYGTHSDIWYTPYLIGGFLTLERLNSQYGFSILRRRSWSFGVWLVCIAFTLAAELLYNGLLDLWDYPSYDRVEFTVHVALIGWPMTAFFWLEFIALCRQMLLPRRIGITTFVALTLVFAYLCELPNVAAQEWVYHNWPFGSLLGVPVAAILLWVPHLWALKVLLEPQFYSEAGRTRQSI